MERWAVSLHKRSPLPAIMYRFRYGGVVALIGRSTSSAERREWGWVSERVMTSGAMGETSLIHASCDASTGFVWT
eukprot:32957-Eustigmatos_ZCMA.PRE.1